MRRTSRQEPISSAKQKHPLANPVPDQRPEPRKQSTIDANLLAAQLSHDRQLQTRRTGMPAAEAAATRERDKRANKYKKISDDDDDISEQSCGSYCETICDGPNLSRPRSRLRARDVFSALRVPH
eukprot:4233549-Pleurochrysis_carterae.AAC.2